MPILEVDMAGAIPKELIDLCESESIVAGIVDTVAASARAYWIKLAQDELRSSARAYVDAIQPIEEEGPTVRTITLAASWLPAAVESGVDEFDLRDTLLTSPRAKTGRNGSRYMAIPFRHGTPGTLGHVGRPMGSSYGPPGMASRALFGELAADHALEFGEAVYAEAKKLRGKQRLGHGTAGAPKLAPHHSTDIYAGMQRRSTMITNERTGKASPHTQYMTFRTISSKKPTGWIHPGIEPRNFVERVADRVRESFAEVVAATMSGALGAPP